MWKVPYNKDLVISKTTMGILTDDSVISSELRNEFLSQSLDSEINTDYS